MAIFGGETRPALPENYFFLKMPIFGTKSLVFDPQNGFFSKSLKRPQNNFYKPTNQKWRYLEEKRTLHCLKTDFFLKMPIFGRNSRVFDPKNWIFFKIVKTSTKQLYYKPKNQ